MLLETQEAALLEASELAAGGTEISFAAREKKFMTTLLFKQTK
jgi:hypothetical protein